MTSLDVECRLFRDCCIVNPVRAHIEHKVSQVDIVYHKSSQFIDLEGRFVSLLQLCKYDSAK